VATAAAVTGRNIRVFLSGIRPTPGVTESVTDSLRLWRWLMAVNDRPNRRRTLAPKYRPPAGL
jgi:hypothetical protein